MAASTPTPNGAPPSPDFQVDEALAPWQLPAKAWLVKHSKDKEWHGLASGTVVFDAGGRVLLIQRASHDSMPNRWEIPGGAVDDDDATILHGAARELREEAGLVATRFKYTVSEGADIAPTQVFSNRAGTRTFRRIVFVADVESCGQVKLDPNEHQAFVWASEDVVRNEKMGDRDLPITHPSMRLLILEAFRLKRVLEA